MDVHVRRAVTIALRLRSIDVLTAQEDGSAELADDVLLERATELGRVLVSQDEDLLREGARWAGARISLESSTRIGSAKELKAIEPYAITDQSKQKELRADIQHIAANLRRLESPRESNELVAIHGINEFRCTLRGHFKL